MQRIFKLKGKVQNYAWGGNDFIPNLLGLKSDGQSYAEYWLGAHVNAPAFVETMNGSIALDKFLADNPKQFLGNEIYNMYGRLPYLFKVLDVHDMLSIQVHPSKNEAEKGFKKENELKIPLKAPNRNYKDDNHKPEIMVALNDFWLLHGFLPKDSLIKVLEARSELNPLIDVFNKGSYRSLYEYVMRLPEAESNAILGPLISRIMPQFKQGKIDKMSPDFWAAKAAIKDLESGNFDKGIYSIYFFNILNVNQGVGVFQDAGIPHAYLEGQTMELMANSDNVLRGGLTPKHIDIPELLKHIVFEETHPKILKGELINHGMETVYKSIAPDFELSHIVLKEKEVLSSKSKTAEVFILMEGIARVTENEHVLELKKGDSFIALADAEFTISAESGTNIYKATTPY
ncbi:mannose-6-phosphate isomerase, class I [Lutimonas halocynthiae]|uniref:mannose-6-phosphate isomerase, class I n=1 Tax=Lutimonas halocynthiae TaxID=1446477 RepID=UPI0025B61D90|nr:mannose-6-phosphate isomerase, class I [Lutimonas halocynthiae]MDN3641538.1 mannose-6-phosphate isomerase, class I [Lutimonas halocynthiae]